MFTMRGGEIKPGFKLCPFCGNNDLQQNSGNTFEGVVKTRQFVGGNQHIKNIHVEKESSIATKKGDFCATCRVLLENRYFECRVCKKINCLDCRDSNYKGICEGCGALLKKEQQNIEKERQQKIEKEKREKEKPSNLYSLRKTPIKISEDDNYKQEFGLDDNRKPFHYINNDYQDNNNGTITDNATGLIWQKSGSNNMLKYKAVKAYIKSLNNSRFAGQNDWRLPTIPELISLLEPSEKSKNLYIDPIFDKTQNWCWSADQASSGRAWLVHFYDGRVRWNLVVSLSYVRGVRCRQ